MRIAAQTIGIDDVVGSQYDLQCIRNLWAAVLMNGINDYLLVEQKKERGIPIDWDDKDVITWMHSNSKNIGSWLWCCLMLGIDGEMARKKAFAYVDAQMADYSPTKPKRKYIKRANRDKAKEESQDDGAGKDRG